MNLHDARQVGSTSKLLNNIDKYVKTGQFISTLPGRLDAEIEKLLNRLWINEKKKSKCVKKAKS